MIDVALKAVAGGYVLTPATANLSPNKDLGDGVDAPYSAASNSFPYVALPHSGSDAHPHS